MLPKKLQAQLICDRLNGLDVKAKPQDFETPFAECWMALQNKTDRSEMIAAIGQVLDLSNHPENQQVLSQILSLKPGSTDLLSLQDIQDEIQPVEWVWEGFIPRNYVTILGAMQGAGKTALMLDIARRITNIGETWPDGKPVVNSDANIFYLDAEGMPEVIKERAIAWQINLKRFFYKYPKTGEIFDLGQERYQDMVLQAVYHAQPEIIFVDSLGSINTKGENNIEDVRTIFAFLSMLARDFKAGLVLSHHLRKRFGVIFEGSEINLDDFRGSGHVTQIARSVLALSVIQTTEEMDRNGPRKLEVLKNNLGASPKPLGFEFVPGYPKGFVLKWGDAPKKYKPPTKEELCAEWLLEALGEEPVSLRDLVKLGEPEGFSKALILRAHKKLGNLIVDTKGPKDPANKWQLRKLDGQ
jgi:hypothetical protein